MGNKDDENEHQTVDEKEAINLADSLGGIFQKVHKIIKKTKYLTILTLKVLNKENVM